MTFLGYRRENGTVGVRNHLLVLASVSCANGVVEATKEIALAVDFSERVEAVHFDDGQKVVNQRVVRIQKKTVDFLQPFRINF
mgnify:CR=1 FL=1